MRRLFRWRQLARGRERLLLTAWALGLLVRAGLTLLPYRTMKALVEKAARRALRSSALTRHPPEGQAPAEPVLVREGEAPAEPPLFPPPSSLFPVAEAPTEPHPSEVLPGARTHRSWPAGSLAETAWAVRATSRAVPRSTCLTRALTARLLLALEGHDSRVCIGAHRDSSGQLHAHAWLEASGEVVVGASAVEYVRMEL